MFKNFQALVDRHKIKKLKCICSDNDGEYIDPFDRYCREKGIRHQKTPSKTPQLSGLAEMINKTLVERFKCMLSDAKLLDFFGEKNLILLPMLSIYLLLLL